MSKFKKTLKVALELVKKRTNPLHGFLYVFFLFILIFLFFKAQTLNEIMPVILCILLTIAYAFNHLQICVYEEIIILTGNEELLE